MSNSVGRLALSVFCVVLSGCGLDETTSRADKPVSRAEASKEISLPFPSSARDVYYHVHAGGMQEFEMFVRFTADSNELDSAANNILSNHDRTLRTRNSFTRHPVAGAPASSNISTVLPGAWWNPDAIAHGYYYQSSIGQPAYFWIDLDRNIVYFCATD